MRRHAPTVSLGSFFVHFSRFFDACSIHILSKLRSDVYQSAFFAATVSTHYNYLYIIRNGIFSAALEGRLYFEARIRNVSKRVLLELIEPWNGLETTTSFDV
jgi:hypothetical protein